MKNGSRGLWLVYLICILFIIGTFSGCTDILESQGYIVELDESLEATQGIEVNSLEDEAPGNTISDSEWDDLLSEPIMTEDASYVTNSSLFKIWAEPEKVYFKEEEGWVYDLHLRAESRGVKVLQIVVKVYPPSHPESAIATTISGSKIEEIIDNAYIPSGKEITIKEQYGYGESSEENNKGEEVYLIYEYVIYGKTDANEMVKASTKAYLMKK